MSLIASNKAAEQRVWHRFPRWYAPQPELHLQNTTTPLPFHPFYAQKPKRGTVPERRSGIRGHIPARPPSAISLYQERPATTKARLAVAKAMPAVLPTREPSADDNSASQAVPTHRRREHLGIYRSSSGGERCLVAHGVLQGQVEQHGKNKE